MGKIFTNIIAYSIVLPLYALLVGAEIIIVIRLLRVFAKAVGV